VLADSHPCRSRSPLRHVDGKPVLCISCLGRANLPAGRMCQEWNGTCGFPHNRSDRQDSLKGGLAATGLATPGSCPSLPVTGPSRSIDDSASACIAQDRSDNRFRPILGRIAAHRVRWPLTSHSPCKVSVQARRQRGPHGVLLRASIIRPSRAKACALRREDGAQ
jgi:hypothetical protein